MQSIVKNTASLFYPRPQGKVYLVTGASRGLGREIAMELARQGKSLVLVARNEGALLKVKQEIIRKYSTCVFTISYDVTEFDSYGVLLKAAHHEVGPVDTIVLIAGTCSAHCVGKNGFNKDLKVLETNLIGPIASINEFVDYATVHQIKSPHIVCITSIAADAATAQAGAYCASKSGLSIYIEACALELQNRGFWFTNIKPGFISTEMSERSVKDQLRWASTSARSCAKAAVAAINKRSDLAYVPWFYYYLGTFKLT